MAAGLRAGLQVVRRYGGSILKFIGLGTVAAKVTGANDKVADWVTMGIIGFIVLLILGRK